MHEATHDGVSIGGRTWIPCSNRDWRCNWLVADDAGAARCMSCRLNRQRPDASDTIALEKLADASQVMRRLLVQLADLGIPVEPYYEREGGLAFDLLSSYSGQGRVTIGHANGVVTIDLVETLDDYREAMRIKLGEPYRTMLGHFRHEVGHYYQWILVEQTEWIDECRELFGDERASYSDAIDRHYEQGAPDGWEASYISEYATMHPWEDFAESFAHYLHITDSLSTAAAGGLVLQASRVDGLVDADIEPRASYQGAPTTEMLDDWRWLSLLVQPRQPRDGSRRHVPVHAHRAGAHQARLCSSVRARRRQPELRPTRTRLPPDSPSVGFSTRRHSRPGRQPAENA